MLPFGLCSRNLSRVCLLRNRLHTYRSYTIKVGDRILLSDFDENVLLTHPIRPDGTTHSRWGDIRHDAIIGTQAGRQRIVTAKGKEITFSVPTLAEYITLTPRMVTPIYAADAAFVVNLLDIHASPRPSNGDDEPPLEILEAGTGHGSLTLHLARAIHAINAPTLNQGVSPNQTSSCSTQVQRRAVVHTVEVSSQYSEHARKIVHGFRQGLYAEDVVFHVAKVSDWLHRQFSERELEDDDGKAFLSHIILDMPDSYRQVEIASSALRADGSLLLFNPSITQITSAVELVKRKKLPLFLEQVIELGPSLTGGKAWDIRAIRPRKVLQAEHERKLAQAKENASNAMKSEHDEKGIPSDSLDTACGDSEQSQAAIDQAEDTQMICRPKAFARVLGGGFLGVWRKKIPYRKS